MCSSSWGIIGVGIGFAFPCTRVVSLFEDALHPALRHLGVYLLRSPPTRRPAAAAALAMPDLAALIFSAYCSGIRGDFHPPTCVLRGCSPSGRAVRAPCPRPATAAQRRDSGPPSGLRPLPLPCGKPSTIYALPCSFAALAIPPRCANTFSPYLIGTLVSSHRPACMTEAMSILSANKSCAAPTRQECPEIRRTCSAGSPIHTPTFLSTAVTICAVSTSPTPFLPKKRNRPLL
jgi:hypothetical protein